jgi:gliding motility-associated-like protein
MVLTGPDTLTIIVTHLQSACTDSVTMNVVDFCPSDSVFFPTAFTPNGDQVNDFFGGYGEGIGTFQLLVYNRWGEQMFAGETLNAHWDGLDTGGKPALPGAYMWRASYRPIIDGVGNEGSWLEQFGTVILIR